jgi:hypothetical protein
MTALRSSSEVEPVRVAHAPPAPNSIAETGLEIGFLVDLLAKTIYRKGLERPSDFGREMKLPAGLILKLIEAAQSMKLMETLGQLGASVRPPRCATP